jgi:hypothetical protein
MKLQNLLNILVPLLRRGIGPTQGVYVHRTAQHKKMCTYMHASSGIRTHGPSVLGVQDRTRSDHEFTLRLLFLGIIKINKAEMKGIYKFS